MNIVWFFLLNFVIAFSAMILYLILKEITRISNNKSKSAFIINQLLVFVFVFLVQYYFFIFLSIAIVFTLTLIYLLLIPLLLDYRLIYSLTIAAISGLAFSVTYNSATIDYTNLFVIGQFILILAAFIFVITINNLPNNYFVKKIVINPNNWYWFLLASISICFFILSLFKINQGVFASWLFFIEFLICLIIYSFYYYLQLILFHMIDVVYINYSKLETFATSDEISFYKISLAQQVINNKIRLERTSTGLIIIFTLNLKSEVFLTTEAATISKLKQLRIIREKFLIHYPKTLFSRINQLDYLAFIPFDISDYQISVSYQNNFSTKRTSDDFLFEIDQFFNEINQNYNFDIHAGVTIYGLQSCDLNELISSAKFLLTKQIRRHNAANVILFDYSRIQINSSYNIKINDLSLYINSLKINFTLALSHQKIYYPTVYFLMANKYAPITSLARTLSYDDELFLQRYIAIEILKQSKKLTFDKLVINYPLNFVLSDKFNFELFIKRINNLGINAKNLIICFDLINQLTLSKQQLNVLNSFNDYDFELAIKNFSELSKVNLKQLNHQYHFNKHNKLFAELIPSKKPVIKKNDNKSLSLN